jgi:hypothetical protein
LKQAPELRRMVKYRQGIAIIDTADPILFRFLPRADTGDVAVPPERAVMESVALAEAVEAMDRIKEAEKSQSPNEEQASKQTEVSQAHSIETQRADSNSAKRIGGPELKIDIN